MTAPEVRPDEPVVIDRRERLVQRALVALVVLVAAAIGLPQLVESVREGTVELATVFYPVLLVAFAVLAWTRRTGP